VTKGKIATVKIIYFTRELPALTEELSEFGLELYEALAISEVFYFCEQHPTAPVVIDSTVEDAAAHEIVSRHIALRLKAEANAADLIWELSNLNDAKSVLQ
jgi:hypothetical protein